MAKSALRCAGKYVRGSGVEDAFIETQIFGPKTLESVLAGGHYYRSFCGLMMLNEAIDRLKLEGFWSKHSSEQFQGALTKLSDLKIAVSCKQTVLSRETMKKLLGDSEVKNLIDAVKCFDEKCASESEQCKFWYNFQHIMNVIKDLIRADRDGDFLLSIKSIQSLCPIFLGCDAIHYLRYGSFYVETLKSLQHEHPDLYSSFLKGDFVVKTSRGRFNAVAVDMKLEQTIQRSAKSVGGIIGRSKAVDYVTEWSIIYHDVLGITNMFRDLTGADTGGNTETFPHHQLRQSKISEININVSKLEEFIRSRGNPYLCQEADRNLKNFVTQIEAEEEIVQAHCSFPENAEEQYEEFRRAIFVDKTRLLSDKIAKFRLKPINFIASENSNTLSKKDIKKDEKMTRRAIKTLLIAKEKTNDLELVLKHDITTYNCLFDGSEMTKTNKSQLISELKAYLIPEDYTFDSYLHHVFVVVDFMSYFRSQMITAYGPDDTFGSIMTPILVKALRKYPGVTVHFIFDSYAKISLKGIERERRANQGVIHLSKIESNTPIPQQINKFWSSDSNKVLLQKFAKDVLLDLAKTLSVTVVTSGVCDDLPTSATIYSCDEDSYSFIPELQFNYEEADWRIIPHLQWNSSCFPSVKSSLVVSNDSDVLVLLVHYFEELNQNGLEQLWLEIGTGSNKVLLPVHILCQKLGKDQCRNLLKVHLGTGCDYLSKLGTKKSALAVQPANYLDTFGVSDSLDEYQLGQAEKFLVKVYGKNSLGTETTFDELRLKIWKRTGSVYDLPCTSHSIRFGHIPRWWFLYKKMSSFLTPGRYDYLHPDDYGWEVSNDELIPRKFLNLLPDELVSICNCTTGCTNNRCRCLKNGFPCTNFCMCCNCENV